MIANQKSGGLQIFRDGFTDLSGGMDSSRAADLISPQHVALAVNVTFRGGKPKTRPSFVQRVLQDDAAYQKLRDGRYQGGMSYYSTLLGRSILLAVYSGWLFSIDITNGQVKLLNPNSRNDQNSKHYLLQAENYVVVQNGTDTPLIWDGEAVEARRSRTGTNNPVLGTANSNISRNRTTATITTSTPHGLSNGDYVQLENVDVAGYNTQFYVRGVTANSFQITVDSTLDTPEDFGITRYAPEVPVGSIMGYGQGRIFVASPSRTSFTAGDIIYGDLNGSVKNILRWTENQYLAEGISFRLPANQGRITAMSFPTFQDTAAGHGELFVFGEYGISSFQVSAPRASVVGANGETLQPGWRDIQIQKIVLSGTGCTSSESVVNFTNGDMFYRDSVGIRSYRNARADMQSYGQTPISAELSRILDQDPKTRLAWISAAHFEDRAIFTCSPQVTNRRIRITSVVTEQGTVRINLADTHNLVADDSVTVASTPGINGTWNVVAVGSNWIRIQTTPTQQVSVSQSSYISAQKLGQPTTHKALAVLDFNSTSTVGGKSAAAWDGIWTGLDFQQIVYGYYDGNVRCFAFVDGGVGQNQIWEITSDVFGGDRPYGQDPTPIECQLETRSYEFETPFTKKKLRRLDLWISDIDGHINFEAAYRFDGRSCWQDWPPNWSRCAEVSTPSYGETDSRSRNAIQSLPQVRTQITHPIPPNVCEGTQGGFTHIGFEVQLRFVWVGELTIEKALITADDVVEITRAICPAGPS